MSKKQTRRSVSIRGTTYENVREYCEKMGISMSEFVEQRIATFFDGSMPATSAHGRPAPRPAKPLNGRVNTVPRDRPLNARELQDAAREFTF